MFSASSVPCPWNCSATVDVASDEVWELDSQEAHVCTAGIRWRMLELATFVIDRPMGKIEEDCAFVLNHFASELRLYFHNHEEVVRVRRLLRLAAKEIEG